jgi:hypothetical protein
MSDIDLSKVLDELKEEEPGKNAKIFRVTKSPVGKVKEKLRLGAAKWKDLLKRELEED